MELTKSHLKQLQSQINKSIQTKLVPTFSDSRIDILFLHEDQIPKVEETSDSEDEESSKNDFKMNSSMVNFQMDDENEDDDKDDGGKTEGVNCESTLKLNQTSLNNVSVHVKDGANDISKIFDPDNTSLLYVKKKNSTEESVNVGSSQAMISKSLSSSSPSPISKLKNRSKIPRSSHRTYSKQLQKTGKLPVQLPIMKAPLRISTRSVKPKRRYSSGGFQSQDLRFPKLDHLILRLSEQRSL